MKWMKVYSSTRKHTRKCTRKVSHFNWSIVCKEALQFPKKSNRFRKIDMIFLKILNDVKNWRLSSNLLNLEQNECTWIDCSSRAHNFSINFATMIIFKSRCCIIQIQSHLNLFKPSDVVYKKISLNLFRGSLNLFDK